MSEADYNNNLSSTTSKLRNIVGHHLDLLVSGAIPQMSAQPELLMDRLVTMTTRV